MYNKIASIILNSGRNNNYAGEVFVSQPDANKERLAGKIFVLAEIEGRKSDTQKIINFLVNFFDYNYYGDEKILLRDKVEGLRIEDIFEGVLAKVNKGFLDFLETEHLRIEPENTNLTLGVVHEDKLYFSNYGKNKAFLIYRRKGDYEVINIESNISEEAVVYNDDPDSSFSTKIFSAVINGEIPPYSYFLFTNEALPEYLSNKELVGIITKLPPMVAAEQIKNILQKINSYAPFLGVVIKSTLGVAMKESSEDREVTAPTNRLAADITDSLSSRNAHSSIYHLNYTEQRTEEMLAPAGIISFKKIAKDIANFFSSLKPKKKERKKVLKFHDEDEDLITTPPIPTKNIKKPDLARRDSFMIKEKIFFKKKQPLSLAKSANLFKTIILIFSPSFWVSVYRGLTIWFKKLGKRDRLLTGVLVISCLILIISIFSTASFKKQRQIEEAFNNTITLIEDKKAQIDSYLLYNNDNAALSVLNDATSLINSTAAGNKDQEEKKLSTINSLSDLSDRIQKISKVENFEEVLNFSILGQDVKVNNLSLLGDKLYLASETSQKIYIYNTKDSSNKELAVSADYLSSPSIYNSSIYYLAGDKIITLKNDAVSQVNIDGKKDKDDTLIQIYNNNLYLLSKKDNQIYRYNRFSSPIKWLKEDANLSAVSDFKIDVSIMLSQKNGEVLKFNAGKNDNFKTDIINPSISANKIITSQNNIYLLDLDNNRLINFNKNGGLIKQYRFLKEGVKDFAVDEANKVIYLLTDWSVFKTSL